MNLETMNTIFLYSIVFCFLLEQIRPFQMKWKIGKRELFYFPAFFVLGAFVNEAYFMQLNNVENLLPWSGWMSELPVAANLIFGFVVAEFGLYWLHRLMHTNSIFWKIHSIHHCEHKLNYLNSFFFHPVEILLVYIAKSIPFFIVGMELKYLPIILLFSTMISMFSHLNHKVVIGPLKYVIGNPLVHRFHHSTIEKEALNFSVSFPLWDLVFGTFYFDEKKIPNKVGLFDFRKPYNLLEGMIVPFEGVISFRKKTKVSDSSSVGSKAMEV